MQYEKLQSTFKYGITTRTYFVFCNPLLGKPTSTGLDWLQSPVTSFFSFYLV